MKELNSKEIQAYELGILKKFDEICRSNNLQYSLCGGTMLGAIRHKGFIPWDDDIDVYMKREDYEKLLKLQYEDDIFAIKSYRYSKDYYYLFSKMTDKRTLIDEPWRAEKEMGVYIDIFPLDYFDGSEQKLERIKRSAVRKERIANIYGQKVLHYFGFHYKFLFKVILLPSFPFRRHILRLIENSISKKNGKTYYSQLLNEVQIKHFCPVDWIKDVVELPFEDSSFFVYSEYDKILTDQYGDYMTPPPKEQQKSIHWFKAYSK